MARANGRIEPGQSLSGAISARAWNRAQDAADIVLGARPGVLAGEGYSAPQRVIVTMRKTLPAQAIYPGHAVEFSLDTELNPIRGTSEYLLAANWPATADTFIDTLTSIDTRSATPEKKAQEREKYISHLGQFAPTYSCQLIRPAVGFSGEEIDFFPNVGVAVAESGAADSAVRVCISGPALVYVRYLLNTQLMQPNGCAIRPREVSGVDAPFSNALGCLDAHRGGNIRLLQSREFASAPPATPCVLLTTVML